MNLMFYCKIQLTINVQKNTLTPWIVLVFQFIVSSLEYILYVLMKYLCLMLQPTANLGIQDAEEGILVDKGLILTYLDLDYSLSLLEW